MTGSVVWLGDSPMLNWLACQDMRDRARKLSDRAIVVDNRVGPGFLMLACAGYWRRRGEEIAAAVPDGQVLMGLDVADGDDYGARLP